MNKLILPLLILVGFSACVNNGNEPQVGPTEGNLYEDPKEVYEDYGGTYDNVINYEREVEDSYTSLLSRAGSGDHVEAALDAEKLVDLLYREDRELGSGESDGSMEHYERQGRLPYLLRNNLVSDTNMIKQVYFYDRAYQARQVLADGITASTQQTAAEELSDPTAVRPGTQGRKTSQATFVSDDGMKRNLPYLSSVARIIENAAKNQDAAIQEDAMVAKAKLEALALQVKSGSKDEASAMNEALIVVENMMKNQEANYLEVERQMNEPLEQKFDDYKAYTKDLYYKVRNNYSETAEQVGKQNDLKTTEGYESTPGDQSPKGYKGKEQID